MKNIYYKFKKIRHDNSRRTNLQLLHSILQNVHLQVDVSHEIVQLRLRVEYFNTLCVRVVAYTEWPWN